MNHQLSQGLSDDNDPPPALPTPAYGPSNEPHNVSPPHFPISRQL